MSNNAILIHKPKKHLELFASRRLYVFMLKVQSVINSLQLSDLVRNSYKINVTLYGLIRADTL
jgi:hypothetical protein